MKNFKSLMLAAMAALACIALPSCSDDDDESHIGSKSDLIGLWESTHVTGWEKVDGEKEEWDNADTDWRYEFMSDGSFITFERIGNYWDDGVEGTYSYSGSTLFTITYEGGETVRATVKKLTATELEIEYTWSEYKYGVKYEGYQYMTFRKISGGSNDDNGDDSGDDNTSQFATKIPGTWMQTKVDYLWQSGTKTTDFNAYSYKFIGIEYNERSGNFTFNWLSNPSLSVISSKTYKLNGNKIMDGSTLIGTIEKCDPTSSEWDAMTIVWEMDAEPFNLGADCRTRGYYML